MTNVLDDDGGHKFEKGFRSSARLETKNGCLSIDIVLDSQVYNAI